MKKLAMLIATLLIVCLMACACGTTPAESAAPSSSEAASTQAPASQAPTSQAPASQAPASQAPASQAPTSVTPAPAPGAGTVINFTDYSADFTLDQVLAADTACGSVTAAEGLKWKNGLNNKIDGYTFTCAWQMGTNGSDVRKCVKFTTTGAGTVDVYVKGGSSSVTAYTLYCSGSTEGQITIAYELAKYTFTIPAAGTYAIYAGSERSINLFGLVINA